MVREPRQVAHLRGYPKVLQTFQGIFPFGFVTGDLQSG